MQLTASRVDIGTSRPLVLLNTVDADDLGVQPLDRVRIEHDQSAATGIVKRTDQLVEPGVLGVTEPLHHITGSVDIHLAGTPGSVRYIKKKLDDVELDAHHYEAIVSDIHEHRLTDVELSAYVTATYTNGLSLEETKYLTVAMSDVGQRLGWGTPLVADKHSIGGVGGDCVTPIILSIATTAGLTMPKTSSRAVTSPAGTADVMEVLCDVEFSIPEIQSIVSETNGCLVWGGGVDLSPTDDEIIRAENPLSIDPPGLLIASVLSKKRSAGATHVVIDIPYGEGAKVESLVAARELADDFKRVGNHIDMNISCAITHGTGAVGRGIGPLLEARDVLRVLEGDGPEPLRLKSIQLASMLLDHCDIDASAEGILESGRALERFREIIDAQNGDPTVESSDLEPGTSTATIESERIGIVTRIDNRQLCDLARRAGAPKDAKAGVFIHKRQSERVEPGDRLYTIHAETTTKLEEAETLADRLEPIRVRNEADALVERR